MNTAKMRLLAAAAMLSVAAPALAQQDVPPPAQMTLEGIQAWIKSAKIADQTKGPDMIWNLETASDAGVIYVALEPKDAAGMAKVGVRTERFRPAAGIRSQNVMFDVDCGKNVIKASSDESFTDHNLAGTKSAGTPNGAWTPIASNPIVQGLQKDACTAPTATASNAPKSKADLEKWIKTAGVLDKNVGGNTSLWNIVSTSEIGVLYMTTENVDNDTRSANMIVRLERFNPAPHPKLTTTLSQSETYELNCRTVQARKVASSSYEQHNMLGKKDGTAQNEDWKPVKDQPLLGKTGEEFCKNFEVKREMLGNSKGLKIR